MRIAELAVTSTAIAIQAATRETCLLADEDVREAIDALLNTSAEIINRIRRPLIGYTRHISAMAPGTHILACNRAIEVIAGSLTRLEEGSHIARTLDSPSQRIMTDFREICSANWGDTFTKTRAHIDEYDALRGVIEFSDGDQVV